ncbi:MAG: hypothetical protein LBP33_03510 [Candidatus Adiutrix sp.]|jgi:hypothetical protein|nr:hypothetical protein [Candidatus Adiutrix sp.]
MAVVNNSVLYLLVMGGLILTAPGLAVAESGLCRKGEVVFEGGAIACPACQDLGRDYQPNPKYGPQVNGHMKKALNNDLKSAKWLMAYFSNPAHKNYAEAKKWFGRALGLGAAGRDLPLPGGYDEPYLVTAYLQCGPVRHQIISSCFDVDRNWRPRCYSFMLSSAQLKNPQAKLWRDKYIPHRLQMTDVNFRENKFSIDQAVCRRDGDRFLLTVTSHSAAPGYERNDYFSDGAYIGSDLQNPGLVFLDEKHPNGYGRSPGGDYLALDSEMLFKLHDRAGLNDADCQTFEIGAYPAAPIIGGYQGYYYED